jgi:hypothetical protein
MARTRRSPAKTRAPRAKSRKSAAPPPATAVVEVEIVEEERGLGIEDAVAIFTAILLLVACLLVDADMGRYGKGLFF